MYIHLLSDTTSRHKDPVGASAETVSASLVGCRGEDGGGVGVEVRSLELGAVGERGEGRGARSRDVAERLVAASGSAMEGRGALALCGRVAEVMAVWEAAVAVRRVNAGGEAGGLALRRPLCARRVQGARARYDWGHVTLSLASDSSMCCHGKFQVHAARRSGWVPLPYQQLH